MALHLSPDEGIRRKVGIMLRGISGVKRAAAVPVGPRSKDQTGYSRLCSMWNWAYEHWQIHHQTTFLYDGSIPMHPAHLCPDLHDGISKFKVATE